MERRNTGIPTILRTIKNDSPPLFFRQTKAIHFSGVILPFIKGFLKTKNVKSANLKIQITELFLKYGEMPVNSLSERHDYAKKTDPYITR